MTNRTIKVIISGSEIIVDRVIQINDYEIIAYNFTKDNDDITITYSVLLHNPKVHFDGVSGDIVIEAGWGTRSEGLDSATLRIAKYMEDKNINVDSMAVTPEDFNSVIIKENEEDGK